MESKSSDALHVTLPRTLMRCPKCHRIFVMVMVDDSRGELVVFGLRQLSCPYCGVATEESEVKNRSG